LRSSPKIDVLPDTIDEYLASERNRQRHVAECQEQLGLRPFGKHATDELKTALLPQAIENDQLAFLAQLVMHTCRERGIVVPPASVLERMCADLRHRARREAHRRLTHGLTAEQRKGLDALTERRDGGGLSWLTWLRQMPEASTPSAMVALVERLEHVRAVGIERDQPASCDSAGQPMYCQAAPSTGDSTNCAFCRSCATACVPAMSGLPAADSTVPSKNV
jgi:hypothetical protein